MSAGPVHVHGVEDKPTLRRFRELPFVLHHADERWVPPVRAFDEWRLDARRHPYFRDGDAAYFVARRGGDVVGRIAAHVADVRRPAPVGRFGFFDTVDDDRVVDALIAAATMWLGDQGASTIAGPYAWSAEEEVGLLADGFDHEGATGAPWHPAWYLEQLTRCGFEVAASFPRWEIPASVGVDPPPSAGPPPPVAGRYGDRRLVLDDVVGVPDLGRALVATGIRGAWRIASRARHATWDRAVVTSVDGTAATAIERFAGAAGAAGYSTVISPVGTGPPRTIHVVVTRRL